MRSEVSVLTTPTVDTSGTSVVLSLEDKHYFFGNVHEGTQRACIQNGTRLLKLNDIFLTGRTEWKTTGGIIGFILTVADVMQGATAAAKETILESQKKWEERLQNVANDKERERMSRSAQPKDKLDSIRKPRLNIHGGENVMHLLATARRFIFRKGLPLSIHEYGDSMSSAQPTWQDHNIQVWAMPLQLQDNTRHSDAPQRQKRSFDDYAEPMLLAEDESIDSQTDRKNKLRGVIADMFDSDWRMDALIETPLDKVRLPAKLFIRNPETKSLEPYVGPMPDSGEDVSDILVLVRKPWPGALVSNLPNTQPSSTIISYIVKGHPRRGKFDPVKARSLGIPPGPEFRKLANGEAVKNANGDLISPDEVSGPLRNGRGFGVIEIPTTEYIPSLKNSFAFSSHEIMQDIDAIFWMVGPEVTKDEAFHELIHGQPKIKHIISSPDHCANHLTIDTAAASQIRHCVIDKDRFSVPLHDNQHTAFPPRLSNGIIAQRGLTVTLEPEFKVESAMKPSLLNTLHVAQKVNRKVQSLAQEAHRTISSAEFQRLYETQSLPAEDAEIVTLGTGSALPSLQRNVSATLIRVPKVGSYLLDAGENTMGQLARLYPPEELKKVLQDLKLIWISHLHADHHLGLVSVIRAWHTAVYGDPRTNKQPSAKLLDQISNPVKYLNDRKKLCVVAEDNMLHWLEEYSEIENFGYDMALPLHVLPCQFNSSQGKMSPTELHWHKQPVGFGVDNSAINVAIRKATGLSDLQAVGVDHCSGARAVAMTWSNGLKISYSGDCRPSNKFAKIGADSTVLIHEATFDDDLVGEAKAKKHTTTREAIGVGIRMRAKRMILTHFSQRYSKIPGMENVIARPVDFSDSEENVDDGRTDSVNSNARLPNLQNQSVKDSCIAKDMKIGVAWDLMRVKVKDIMLLDEFKATFQLLYDESDVVDAEKLARKAEAQAALQKREDEKRIKQEKHRQQQMAKAAPKRKSSKSSIRSSNGIRNPASDTYVQATTGMTESRPQASAGSGA